MEKSASRSVWTGSCVNKEFRCVNKEFVNEVFNEVFDDVFDEMFGEVFDEVFNKGFVVMDYFDKRFDGSEFLDKRSKTTGGEWNGSSWTRSAERFDMLLSKLCGPVYRLNLVCASN